MGLFKKKVVKPIEGAVWGHLVSEHKIDVDTLSKEMRCVEKEGTLESGQPVTLLRVFKPKEAEEKSVAVECWETFDSHPELICFEGYLTRANQARLEPR